MTTRADTLFGRIAVELELITEKQLRTVLVRQNKMDDHVPLGILLMEDGLIDQEGLSKIIGSQKERLRIQHEQTKARRADGLFGKLVVALGLAADTDVQDCIDEQAELEATEFKRLGDLLVEKKVLTPEEVALVLEHQDGLVFHCPHCDTRYNVVMFNPGVHLTCYQCHSEIRIPTTAAFVHPVRKSEGSSVAETT